MLVGLVSVLGSHCMLLGVSMVCGLCHCWQGRLFVASVAITIRCGYQGRIQDFHLGGCKRLCARTHITSAKPNALSAGVQGPLKRPGSSRVVLMLSCAI